MDLKKNISFNKAPVLSRPAVQPTSKLADTTRTITKQESSSEEDSEDEVPVKEKDGSKSKLSSDSSSKDNQLDLDWTEEETLTVLKQYGLDTMFPTAWVEDGNESHIFQSPTKQGKGQEEEIRVVNHDVDKGDPLGIKDNITKRPKGAPKLKRLSQILINDKQFDPKIFLLEVHKTTDYKELEQGLQRLKQSIGERHEQSKGLVKKHFAKFVSAKSTVDSFYKEMRKKNLIDRQDYGIAPFANAVEHLQSEAKNLYDPVLERRLKAARIRLTLSILEQWKFFFNLATSLSDMIRKGRYDAAVRDYKKGKSLMLTSFADETIADERKKENMNMLPKSYQSVFEKLWDEVERVAQDFREELFESLSNVKNPIETQEKIIGYLIDLDSKRDPIWCYLDIQYNWVLENLVQVYENHVENMTTITLKFQGELSGDQLVLEEELGLVTADINDSVNGPDNMNGSINSTNSLQLFASTTNISDTNQKSKMKRDTILPSLPWKLDDFKRALKTVTSKTFENEFGLEIYFRYWKQTLRFVADLCQVLKTNLPVLWRACKLYMDSKQLRKHKQVNLQKRIQDCQSMMSNIFEIIQTMINFSFFLNPDDDTESISNEDNDEKELISFDVTSLKLDIGNEGDFDSEIVWKTFQTMIKSLNKLQASEYSVQFKAHPIMIVHFATQIMDLLNECQEDLRTNYTGDEGLNVIESLVATIDTVRERLSGSVCEGWVQVSKTFYEFEDWSFENIANSWTKHAIDCTQLMKLANKFTKFILRSLSLIVVGALGDDVPKTTEPVASHHVERVRIAFFDALFGLLDGFQWQLSSWRDPDLLSTMENILVWAPETHHSKLKSILPEKKVKFGAFLPSECSNFVEITKSKDFKNQDSRHLIILCNLLFLKETICAHSSMIFQKKFRSELILDTDFFNDNCDILERIIIYNFCKRKSVTLIKYLVNALFYSGLDWSSIRKPQVHVHASVSEISKSLVPKIMSEMVMFLAQELLLSLREIDRFNISGMLQVLFFITKVTLEVEFLDSSLKSFETVSSAAIFTQIYESLERATDSQDKQDPIVLNENLFNVKTFLANAKEATCTQFRCLGIMESVK